MPVLIGFPYCAARPRLRSKLPTSTLTTTNSLATSSAFLVFFSEASSARQSSHQLAPKITSTERFVVLAVARACSTSAFAFAVSSYGSPAATAPAARRRIAVERTRRICMVAPSRGEWLTSAATGARQQTFGKHSASSRVRVGCAVRLHNHPNTPLYQ